MAPKRSDEVLFSILKCEMAVMCFMEKIRQLDKLHSGTSYRAVGREFNVNESAIYTK